MHQVSSNQKPEAQSYLPNKSKVKAETYNFMYVPEIPITILLITDQGLNPLNEVLGYGK